MCSRVNRYDFVNKRVAIIGGGSSSIQIVPELRKVPGTKLSVFVRNKTWITNRLGDEIMNLIGWDPNQINSKAFSGFSSQRKGEGAKKKIKPIY